ncbi:HAD-IA family hydrolase [Sediminicoccus sp. KRV36]|uniref:HAD family hydrolase n=1 Tax=Sediminicoccus sp. KRV36 TaxID=3133721 RepID=UPI00200F2F46|nr:HAD-IA family hydrolase [Sediminicoccus rosea]UPY37113.1 HAD-IA family hydrolase [Sediminicoccus rosea]
MSGARGVNIAAILFDCDGVLADSEGLSNAIVAEEVSLLGWALDAEAAHRAFLGLSLPDMRPLIEQRLGQLPHGWEAALRARIARELEAALQPIPGARAALEAGAAAGLPMAVCSNSGRDELAMKLRVLGFDHFFAGRVFTFQDVPRAKPAPDLYLAAAAACGVAPADCLVVEDSPAGVAAGLAAGCRVVSLVPGMNVPFLAEFSRLLEA